jgi:outer membrane protein TolC
LPVLSMLGEPDVRRGAMLGVAPANWPRRIYRRVALTAAEILNGADPATLPVTMLREPRLYLNIETARRVGISPPFEVMTEAVIVGDLLESGSIRVDLRQVMTAAQTQNRDIASARASVAAGAEQVDVAKGALLPQLALGLGGFAIDKDTARFFPTFSQRTLSGSATLSQVIYSDRAWAGYTIEKHLQEAREGELRQTNLDVGLEAATAYFDVLLAQTRLAIQRQNLAFSRVNLERAEVRVQVGDANRSEIYRWESKIAAEQTRVMDAMVARRLALMELNRVIARQLEEPIDLVDVTLADQFEQVVDPRVDQFTRNAAGLEVLRDFLAYKGLLGAPELQQFDASILASERAHQAATRSFWLPDVGLLGSVDHVFARGGEGSAWDDPGLPDDTSWTAGVFLSLPLLEGGSRLAESRRTTQETYRLMRGREATAERIEQNVRTAVFQASASRLAIDLARRAADAASANLTLVADNYLLGLVSLVDLLDAQTNALNTQLAAADAINNYLLDLMRVERAVGQFMFFVEPANREAWIEELEAFATER